MARPDARRALLSVSDKTGIVELARELREPGFELISTGGTARADRGGGTAGHRGRRAHRLPRNHGRARQDAAPEGARRPARPRRHGRRRHARARHRADRPARHQPLPVRARRSRSPAARYEDAIENIDVGGPAMLRAAAKNHERVTVLVDPADYAATLAELRAGGVARGDAHGGSRQRRSATRPSTTPLVSGWLAAPAGRRVDSRTRFAAGFRKRQDLRYGENPHQSAAFYADPLAAGRIHRARRGSCRARSSPTTTSRMPTPRSNACASSRRPPA